MQIKTTLSYHSSPVTLAETDKLKHTLSRAAWWERHADTLVVETANGATPKEVNVEISSKMTHVLSTESSCRTSRSQPRRHDKKYQ